MGLLVVALEAEDQLGLALSALFLGDLGHAREHFIGDVLALDVARTVGSVL